jgi:hypothetical protein
MTTTTTTALAVEVEDGAGERRWRLQPLLDAARLTPAGLAARLNTGANNITQAARLGLTDLQADRWAIRLAFHPVLVWGWAWVDAAPDTASSRARIADDLRGRIARGELQPGDPLPPVKVLAARWRVGDKTVSQATVELERDGLVVTAGRGQRPVVAQPGAVECRTCGECGEPIEAGTEHYPHRPDCTRTTAGWCDCDHPTHPDCCTTCPTTAMRP